MGIYKKLSWFFKDHWQSYFVGVLALFITAILQLIPPRIVGIVVDEIATSTLTSRSLTLWLVILVGSAILAYVLRYVWRVRIWGNSARLEKILRNRLFHHFTQMDSEFFQKYRTGDLMAHATNDLIAIRMVAGGGILTLADSISVGVTTIVAMMLVVDWRLTLMAIIPIPLLAITSRYLGKMLHSRFRDAQDAFSQMNNKVQESLQGIKVIKAFGVEKEDIEDFEDHTEAIVQKNQRVYQVDSLFDPALTFIIGISYAIAILMGGYFIVEDVVTIGEFVTFFTYIGMLVWPMFAIGRLFNIIERGSASYERVESLLAEESSIVEKSGAIDQPISGDLDYAIDSFTYPGDQTPTLQDIHFKIKQGQTLGIVGKTGAGKTSIVKLLLREYDHYNGEINFGGHDIREYTLDALLENIGYVPQNNYLFSTSIRDNIRFSDPETPQEEVERAAKMADIHDDIVEMPKGYDTKTGERGVSLSGGQQQRISIARAILTNPELMILDDSLSAVDAKTERKILEELKAIRADQSTIIIAHRISSVMHADEIIVMEEGSIVERGTHHDLLERGGWYQEMYEKQQLQHELGGMVSYE